MENGRPFGAFWVRVSRAARLGTAVGWSTVACALTAQAGNDDEVLVGSDATLTGGAVTATTHDGSALWYNPAGLDPEKLQQVDVNGTAYTLRIWNIPEYVQAPNGDTVDGDTSEAVTVPSAITYLRRINDRWAVGVGYFLSRWSDIRGHAEISFPDQGGTATWQEGYVQTYSLHNVIVGAGYALSMDLRLGFEFIGFYNGIADAMEVSGGIANGLDSSFIAASQQGTQSHSGLQLGMGLQWHASSRVRLGLTVRSPGLGLLNSYSQRSYLTLGFDSAQLVGVDEGESDTRRTFYQPASDEVSEWRATWVLPVRVRLAMAHLIGRSWWSFDIDYQPPIRGEERIVGERAFRSADRTGVLNARLGGKWIVNDTLAVGAGLFTDRGAEKLAAVGRGRFDFYGLACGIELGNVHRLAADERARSLRFSTSVGARYAFGIGETFTTEVPYLYDFLQSAVDTGSFSLEQRATRAYAHELTLNLGAGIYF